MFRKFLTILLLLGSVTGIAQAQGRIVRDFRPAADSLSVLMERRTGVHQRLKIKQVMKRGSALDFYFDASLSDVPVRKEDYQWLRSTLQGLFPDSYSAFSVGEIYSGSERASTLAVSPLGFDGTPMPLAYRIKDPRSGSIVSEVGRPAFANGLSGRHIAIWPSHGRYYDRKAGRWRWQRPVLFSTVEDLLSTSFVLPYLVPMLENAGAYVMMPRERDVSPVEVIVDNDPARTSRTRGSYSETGSWSDAGMGFADGCEVYSGTQNPFTMGTAREASCTATASRGYAKAVWTPDIPERGAYAVYVSYRTVPHSTVAAHYTVRHLGGETSFTVNQTMGGGTWIYLGTFDFAPGTAGCVELDNVGDYGGVVTADAVKIGGGTGNVAVGPSDGTLDEETSGLPRYAEAARYWLQWAGADPKVYSQHEQKDDYRDDLFCRGDWIEYLSGGSWVNPKMDGKGIPFDLTLAFHTDAGVAPGDTVIGSLAIYTRTNQWRTELPDGEDRRTCRELADIVQSQIVGDIRSNLNPDWTRRQIWNRGYRESRTPPSPALLTESLSHQNFADMKYALDPTFKFTLSRAIYKGMLKYLSGRYGCPYEVEPLPVYSFAAVPVGADVVRLSWLPREDSVEPTARPKGYRLYTRVNDGAFDSGTDIQTGYTSEGRVYTDVTLVPGNVYSFRVTALNGGGESFPSETLAAGVPSGSSFGDRFVAVVNDFTRVSAPVWYDSPQYAGFNDMIDSGVPYIRDIAFTGEMYNNERSAEWQTDENSGFGASYSDHVGVPVAGNTFDFAYRHGSAVMRRGVPFCSMSADAFASSGGAVQASAVDLICGKQVTTICGGSDGALLYSVFPQELQAALSRFASSGGHILVSGSHIGTDVWDRLYPVSVDKAVRDKSVKFVENVLGYRWSNNNACRCGNVRLVRRNSADGSGSAPAFRCDVDRLSFNTDYSDRIYRVEAPDAIGPAGKGGSVIFRYVDSNNSAGVSYTAPDGHRAVSFGFPLETVTSDEAFDALIGSSLQFFGL